MKNARHDLGLAERTMKRAAKLRLVVTAAVLAFGLVITALANHVQSSVLAPLSFLPYLLGVMLGGTAHTPSFAGYLLGLVLECGLIGYLLSGLVYLFVRQEGEDTQHDDSTTKSGDDKA